MFARATSGAGSSHRHYKRPLGPRHFGLNQSTVSYMGEVTRNLQYVAVAGVNAPRLTVVTGGVMAPPAGAPEIASAALIVIY